MLTRGATPEEKEGLLRFSLLALREDQRTTEDKNETTLIMRTFPTRRRRRVRHGSDLCYIARFLFYSVNGARKRISTFLFYSLTGDGVTVARSNNGSCLTWTIVEMNGDTFNEAIWMGDGADVVSSLFSGWVSEDQIIAFLNNIGW